MRLRREASRGVRRGRVGMAAARSRESTDLELASQMLKSRFSGTRAAELYPIWVGGLGRFVSKDTTLGETGGRDGCRTNPRSSTSTRASGYTLSAICRGLTK